MSKIKICIITVLAICTFITSNGQIPLGDKLSLSGNLQTENLFEGLAKDQSSFKWMNNTYLNLNLNSKYITAGARFEFLEYPLPGYEDDFAGYGLGNIFVTGRFKNLEITAGNIYDQFGSGFILRTYEERSMGIDNSLLGGRIKYQPYKGINLKVLGGKQRRYWKYNDGFVFGADAEFNIEQWIKYFEERNTYWSFGASWVTKNEPDENIMFIDEETGWFKRLNLPKNVGAFDVRSRFQKGNFSVLAEYALKANDPSAENGYIYHRGNASMLSASYSKKGISALLQAKRSDNMTFRSKRKEALLSSNINQLPAFTQQHTYSLASIYPYATQSGGEWAFQGEFSYTFPRKTALGGKYGTTVRVNASHVRSLGKEYLEDGGYIKGKEYNSSFFNFGEEVYYQDINIDFDKKITKDFKLNFMYMNQRYNATIVGHAEEGIINSNIFILEGKYQFNKKMTLRAEAQYLLASDYTGKEDTDPIERINQGDWVFGMLELSVAPSWMFTVQDLYNCGSTKQHYYMVSGVFSKGMHRVQLAYGRTRKGYDCSGGVCRMVPETEGFRLNYNLTF